MACATAACIALEIVLLAALSQCSGSSGWDPMPQRSRMLNIREVGEKNEMYIRKIDFHLPTKFSFNSELVSSQTFPQTSQVVDRSGPSVSNVSEMCRKYRNKKIECGFVNIMY